MPLAKALQTGDTIALIAPASTPPFKEKITKSVEYFEKLGYRVVLGKHIEKRYGYLAGTDAERVNDLHTLIANKKVKALFFLRGGYGTIRLLSMLDYDLIKRNPKIIVGYSDATSLFSAIYKKTGLKSLFYGPMPGVDIWNGFDSFAEACMWKALTSTHVIGELTTAPQEIQPVGRLSKSVVEGRMIGGNLTVLASVIGTPYIPSFDKKILMIEDVGEEAYRLDRHLAQLKHSGKLQSLQAILLGQFTDCDAPKDKPSLTPSEVFRDYFSALKVPILSNLPFGHVSRIWTIPYGAKLRIEGTKVSMTEQVLE